MAVGGGVMRAGSIESRCCARGCAARERTELMRLMGNVERLAGNYGFLYECVGTYR